MNWREWAQAWMLAKSRRHELAAGRWMERAEKLFEHVNGGSK